jgi:hypothetical protein
MYAIAAAPTPRMQHYDEKATYFCMQSSYAFISFKHAARPRRPASVSCRTSGGWGGGGGGAAAESPSATTNCAGRTDAGRASSKSYVLSSAPASTRTSKHLNHPSHSASAAAETAVASGHQACRVLHHAARPSLTMLQPPEAVPKEHVPSWKQRQSADSVAPRACMHVPFLLHDVPARLPPACRCWRSIQRTRPPVLCRPWARLGTTERGAAGRRCCWQWWRWPWWQHSRPLGSRHRTCPAASDDNPEGDETKR